jgi:hypothetical protein
VIVREKSSKFGKKYVKLKGWECKDIFSGKDVYFGHCISIQQINDLDV